MCASASYEGPKHRDYLGYARLMAKLSRKKHLVSIASIAETQMSLVLRKGHSFSCNSLLAVIKSNLCLIFFNYDHKH